MVSTQNTPTVVGVIPARLASERLPGKVLRPICGRPMVHWVYEHASKCPLLTELLVATDAEAVRDYCIGHAIPVVMTAATHNNGTERIIEIMDQHSDQQSKDRRSMDPAPHQVYLSIQADEPMVTADHLRLLIEPFLRSAEVQVTTLKTPLPVEEAANPNIVKVTANERGQALYFSRAAIPYRRDTRAAPPYYKHLGLYGYRREALQAYRVLQPSVLERTERLEQLRFLENGIPIYVAETADDTIGVDTEEDLEAVIRHFIDAGFCI